MDRLRLLEYVANGEDSFTEFKREIDHNESFANEMIALANTDGGQIFVGVDDDGAVVGVSDKSQTEQRIINIARNNCVPPIDVLFESIDATGTDTHVMIVHIPKRIGRPYENQRGQCFIRVGSSKRLASPDERARLLEAVGLFHFEETPVPRTTVNDLDKAAFATYYKRVYEQDFTEAEVPLLAMLKNMRFMVEDREGAHCLSVAGLLLFGKQPQDKILYSGISAVRWGGVVAGETIIDRQELYGQLPQIVKTAEAFIMRNTRLSTYINGFDQEDIPEYPRAALREAIVNAVAHRDYSISGSQIRIFIFDDRLEVYSPGRLPNGVTLENVRTHFSRARNDIIMRVLLNLGHVNKLGSGIPRMIRLMRNHSGREPDFEVRDSEFFVRLWGYAIKEL